MFVLVEMLVSQPSDAFWSQLAKPGLQVITQAPAVQVGVPLLTEHTNPQLPQLLVSVWVLTQPLPQATVPEGQAHAPPVQTCPDGQAVPQVPQLLALVCRLASQPLEKVWSQSP